jgi:hypothetical protein
MFLFELVTTFQFRLNSGGGGKKIKDNLHKNLCFPAHIKFLQNAETSQART